MPKSEQTKREEALARQAGYDSLTIDQKIEMVKRRPGANAKELAKLLKQEKK